MTIKEVLAEIEKHSTEKKIKGLKIRPVINVKETKNGIQTYHTYCTACGFESKGENCLDECPECGNSSYQGSRIYKQMHIVSRSTPSLTNASQRGVKVFYVSEDAVIFALISVKYNADFTISSDAPTMSEMVDAVNNAETSINYISEWFYFDKVKGLRVVNKTWRKCPVEYLNALKFFEDEAFALFKKNWENISGQENFPENEPFLAMSRIETESEKKTEEKLKKQSEKRELMCNLAESYLPDNFIEQVKDGCIGHPFAVKTSSKLGIVSANIHCFKCRTKAEIQIPAMDLDNNKQETHCPYCGAALNITKKNNYATTAVLGKESFDFVSGPNGELLIYASTPCLNVIDDTVSVQTIHCYVFSNEGTFFYFIAHFNGGIIEWKPVTNSTLDDLKHRCYSNSLGLYDQEGINVLNNQSNESLEDAINMSTFAGTGLLEYLKHFAGKTNMTNFFIANHRFKVVQDLARKNAWDLIDELSKSTMSEMKRNFCNTSGKTFQEFFNCDSMVEEISTENHLPIDEILSLRDHLKLDPSASYEDINWSFTQYTPYSYSPNRNPLLKLMGMGITLKEARQYISALYYKQCIDWNEAPMLWSEYLTSLSTLNLSQKEMDELRMPSSLKKAKDIITLAKEYSSDKETSTKIGDAISRSASLNYEDSNFIIRAPKDTNEIIKEGLVQNRSVARIIELEADGKTSLMLMRSASDPDTPLYSIEIEGRKILQARGFQNRQIIDPEALDFLKKWSSAS